MMKGKKEAMGQRGAARDCRILYAVVIGVTMGIFWAYLRPHGFFRPATPSTLVVDRVGGATSKLDGAVLGLEAKVAMLEREIKRLENENKELSVFKIKNDVLQQEATAAKKQLEALSPSVKIGPPGTVKSIRTNPKVQPDDSVNPKLSALLKKIAVNGELIVGISNNNVQEMVKIWFESIQRAGVTNYLIVALDDEIAKFCTDHDVPVYRRDATIAKVQADTGDNHAISGSKFHLLREFLVLGYSVLLSDVDIVYLQNPFKYLHRDCDVESMSDGFDNITAYGYDDVMDEPSMGWARYAHTMRIWVFNSGLFYIRPTVPSIELLDRVTAKLAKEKAWDQAVFNEELFNPSHPGYDGLHASRRVLDFYQFMNSKVLFKILRKEANFADYKPVTIHVNYHPDKHARMLAIVEYYVKGNKDALKHFPDGSEW
ncbi:hypothetical protein KC19_4G140200 [Ceratodon purpureus]|uniref:Glycosyltransferase n=1 Tax=Ceratodon purpureus TaxID=3225 RepID=A0A8T0IBX0_CERPU|nr:hypothetical protein KC19_4G140200 [Ceratodon purpureus]